MRDALCLSWFLCFAENSWVSIIHRHFHWYIRRSCDNYVKSWSRNRRIWKKIVGNVLNHALVTRSHRLHKQSICSVCISRQDFANHVHAKGVLERHVTLMNSLSPLFWMCALCMWEMRFLDEKITNVVENLLFWSSKIWKKAHRCRSVSIIYLKLRFVVVELS